jgi:uncharacterized protein with HEPN domain
MNFSAFREDPKTVAAVERKLQIISEAAIRLGAEAENRCPGPAWRDIRGMGNWLRHQYERIELPVIWKTVRDDLPPLRNAVLSAWFAEVTLRLNVLRNALSSAIPEAEPKFVLFDEFLSVHEFGLALLTLCDLLLEPEAPALSPELLSELYDLYSLMGIEDDCIERLRHKS